MKPYDMDKKADELRRHYTDLNNILSDAVGELESAAGGLWKKLYPIFMQSYKEAGEPFGESEEGFLRWLHERAENAALAEKMESGLSAPEEKDGPEEFDTKRNN